MDNAQALGQRIRALRLRRKLSIETLAERASVSTGYLSRLENGEYAAPSYKRLTQIAEALGIDTEEITHPAEARQTNLSGFGLDLHDLSQEELESVRIFVDYVRSRRPREDK